MTNKEKLQEVFPNIIFIGTVMLYKSTEQVLASGINYNWLNAEYQELSSSKNSNKSEIPTGSDDCISRQAVEDAMYDATRAMDLNYGQIMDYIDNLPSVTPIEPKGHWIDITNKNKTVIAVRCSCCEKSPKYAIKSDYCPNCGAKMEEVKE
jgi:hypothetical protein